MSDSNLLFSYLAKLAKENIAKLIGIIFAALLVIFFLKWLIAGGFGLLFDTIFGSDKDEVIHDQRAAITQLEDANKRTDDTIATLKTSASNLEAVLENHHSGQIESAKKFDNVLQKGDKAYQEARQASKSVKVGGNQRPSAKTPTAPSDDPADETSVEDPLLDPHSPQSMKLAQSQYDMVHEAFCIASPDACKS